MPINSAAHTGPRILQHRDQIPQRNLPRLCRPVPPQGPHSPALPLLPASSPLGPRGLVRPPRPRGSHPIPGSRRSSASIARKGEGEANGTAPPLCITHKMAATSAKRQHLRPPPCCPFIAWPLLLTNRIAPRPPPPLSLPNRRASRVAPRPAQRPSLVPEGGSRPSCRLRGCRPRAGAGVARTGFICLGLNGPLSPSLYCGRGLREEPAGTEGVPAGAPPLRDLTSPALAAFFLLGLTPAPFCYRDTLQQAEVQAVRDRPRAGSNGQIPRERELPGPAVAGVPAQLCPKGDQAGSQGCSQQERLEPCAASGPAGTGLPSPRSKRAPQRSRGRGADTKPNAQVTGCVHKAPRRGTCN